MTRKEWLRGVGSTTEPTREKNSGRESYTQTPAIGSAEPAAAAPRHEKEAAARAAVASIAINEAGKMSDLAEKRQRLELARTQLVRSLRRLEADLERLSA